jgi:hypothetical protein
MLLFNKKVIKMGSEVGRSLNLTQSAISRAVKRGEPIANEIIITLIDRINA